MYASCKSITSAEGFIAECTVFVMKYGAGYLAYALIRIKSKNMFSMNL